MIDIVDTVLSAMYDFFVHFVPTDIFSIFVMSSVLCICVWSFLGGVLK